MVQQTTIQTGTLPSSHGFIQWSGDALALSSVKIAEETNDLIIRWYNMSLEQTELELSMQAPSQAWYKSTILEERNAEIIPAETATMKRSIVVKAAEIVTLGCNKSIHLLHEIEKKL